jgi:hypothetical protein
LSLAKTAIIATPASAICVRVSWLQAAAAEMMLKRARRLNSSVVATSSVMTESVINRATRGGCAAAGRGISVRV